MNPAPSHPDHPGHHSDEQIMAAIRENSTGDQLLLKWFFSHAREYAMAYWRKKYARLQPEDWDVVFANTNLKLITRIKKGLSLQAGTQLTTYYTGIVGYAILDHIEEQKPDLSKIKPLYPKDSYDAPKALETLEQKEKAEHIRNWLCAILGNEEQVRVMLLYTKGYSYKEIVEKTAYQSEGACRNAFLKGKKKMVAYILDHPEEGEQLKALIAGK